MLTTWEQDIADGFKLEIDYAKKILEDNIYDDNEWRTVAQARINCASRLARLVVKHLGCNETEFLTACGVI